MFILRNLIKTDYLNNSYSTPKKRRTLSARYSEPRCRTEVLTDYYNRSVSPIGSSVKKISPREPVPLYSNIYAQRAKQHSRKNSKLE